MKKKTLSIMDEFLNIKDMKVSARGSLCFRIVGFFEWPAPSLSVVCLVWLSSIWDCALFGFLLNVESRNIFVTPDRGCLGLYSV